MYLLTSVLIALVTKSVSTVVESSHGQTSSDILNICRQYGGYYRDPNECKCFYQCSPNRFWRMCCADGQAFDDKNRVCVPEEQIQCRSSRPMTSVKPTFRKYSPCNIRNGMFKHEECGKYWHCFYQRFFEMSCPEGTLWNDYLKICSLPQFSTCNTLNEMPTNLLVKIPPFIPFPESHMKNPAFGFSDEDSEDYAKKVDKHLTEILESNKWLTSATYMTLDQNGRVVYGLTKVSQFDQNSGKNKTTVNESRVDLSNNSTEKTTIASTERAETTTQSLVLTTNVSSLSETTTQMQNYANDDKISESNDRLDNYNPGSVENEYKTTENTILLNESNDSEGNTLISEIQPNTGSYVTETIDSAVNCSTSAMTTHPFNERVDNLSSNEFLSNDFESDVNTEQTLSESTTHSLDEVMDTTTTITTTNSDQSLNYETTGPYFSTDLSFITTESVDENSESTTQSLPTTEQTFDVSTQSTEQVMTETEENVFNKELSSELNTESDYMTTESVLNTELNTNTVFDVNSEPNSDSYSETEPNISPELNTNFNNLITESTISTEFTTESDSDTEFGVNSETKTVSSEEIEELVTEELIKNTISYDIRENTSLSTNISKTTDDLTVESNLIIISESTSIASELSETTTESDLMTTTENPTITTELSQTITDLITEPNLMTTTRDVGNDNKLQNISESVVNSLTTDNSMTVPSVLNENHENVTNIEINVNELNVTDVTTGSETSTQFTISPDSGSTATVVKRTTKDVPEATNTFIDLKVNHEICKEVGGYYVDANDCKCFYVCDMAFRPYRHCCPDGLYFNENSEDMLCDYPENVVCNGSSESRVRIARAIKNRNFIKKFKSNPFSLNFQ